MKKLILTIAILLIAGTSFAQNYKYVNPYYRKDGTHVSGHYKDVSGDGVVENNWGTRFNNSNPYIY